MPLSYPGTIEVHVFAGNAGRSSLVTFYELRLQGDDRLYAEGSAKIVWINPASGNAILLAPGFYDRIHDERLQVG